MENSTSGEERAVFNDRNNNQNREPSEVTRSNTTETSLLERVAELEKKCKEVGNRPNNFRGQGPRPYRRNSGNFYQERQRQYRFGNRTNENFRGNAVAVDPMVNQTEVKQPWLSPTELAAQGVPRPWQQPTTFQNQGNFSNFGNMNNGNVAPGQGNFYPGYASGTVNSWPVGQQGQIRPTYGQRTMYPHQGPHGVCFECGDSRHYRNMCPRLNRGNNQAGVTSGTNMIKVFPINEANKAPEGQRVYLDARVNKIKCKLMLDTGAQSSMIPENMVHSNQIIPIAKRAIAVNGSEVTILGQTTVDVELGTLKIPTTFLVAININGPILGYDFMAANKATWRIGNNSIMLHSKVFPLNSKCIVQNVVEQNQMLEVVDSLREIDCCVVNVSPEIMVVNINDGENFITNENEENEEEVYFDCPSNEFSDEKIDVIVTQTLFLDESFFDCETNDAIEKETETVVSEGCKIKLPRVHLFDALGDFLKSLCGLILMYFIIGQIIFLPFLAKRSMEKEIYERPITGSKSNIVRIAKHDECLGMKNQSIDEAKQERLREIEMVNSGYGEQGDVKINFPFVFEKEKFKVKQ